MDLKELTTFRTIIKEGTFSKAAEALHYAQSTVTHQVQRLEKELGFPLFKRGWEAELTEAGQRFAKEVDSLISHWQYAADQAKQLQQEELGTVKIGAIEPAAADLLPDVLSRFREVKPNVNVEVVVGNTDVLAAALQRGGLDAAVCAEVGRPSDFIFEPLYKEEIAFIAAKQHPLADKKELALKEIAAYPLVVGGKTCLYSLKLEKELAVMDTVPFSHSISQISAIPAYASKLGAVGVVLRSTPVSEALAVLPVTMADPFIPVGIVRRREGDYFAAFKHCFLDILREACYARVSHLEMKKPV
ncbi:LysR family transcriptional regulator [Paenibacillus protaetiae]|uniref:LysR family transcriptional regulator n=1 Tax=Paenibacillus protaetiae TaxID=2509456 RepID=A0A4P6EV85_9BACL|nr:LysR family transcriptional regulator [Paenibacillus protaetiae]QAY67200.1 LysR family transcriptional regulator [Paenibacillus protaetiae]